MKSAVLMLVGLFVVLLCTSLLAHAGQVNVLFDEAHDELNTISEARARIINPAHPEWYYFGKLAERLSYEYVLERGLSPFDSDLLDDFDVVIIATPRASFTEQELDALKLFVEEGGGLLVVQDANPPIRDGSNQIARLFGAQFHHGVLRSEHGDWDAESFRVDVVEAGHAIIQGSDDFQMNWGCSIAETPDFDVLLESRADTWQDSNGNRVKGTDEPIGPLTVAVANEVGEGRVVFIADNAFHDTVWDSNRTFFIRAVRWLAEATTQPATVIDLQTNENPEIAPDVTLDSVVQVGTGPQELSTDIKFYPNTRRIKPGETVYWTLDLGELEGPFTITAELNNDASRDGVFTSDGVIITIPFTYEQAAIYIPYVMVASAGFTKTIYTKDVLAVIPELKPRDGIALKVPTRDDPVGDIVKGIQVLCLDEQRLDDESGKAGVKAEIAEWAATGVNLVMYNIALFVDSIDDNVTYPFYGDDGPISFASTWSIDSLITMTEYAHEAGIRVAFRPHMLTSNDPSGSLRCHYAPANPSLYFDYHIQIKSIYAELAETLGVCMFNIDSENPATSMLPEAIAVVQAVRSVYSGVICDSPTISNQSWGLSSLHELVDVLYASLGPYFTDIRSAPETQLYGAQYTQMTNEILPILYRIGKPGIVETFVLGSSLPAGGLTPSSLEHQELGYQAILEYLAKEASLLMGYTFWETNLDDRRYGSGFDPFGRPAEAVLSTYFTDRIPEQRVFDFEEPLQTPAVLLVLEDFEGDIGNNSFAVAVPGGTVAISKDLRTTHEGGSSCHVAFTLSAVTSPTYYSLLRRQQTMDWSGFRTFNMWVKADGTKGDFRIQLWDQDGDRFTSTIAAPPAEFGWVLLTLRLTDLVQPAWCEHGDGRLDLARIQAWSISQWSIEPDSRGETWYDFIYLGN
ncbi:hypothetical protein ACFLS5_04780 [Candidatus Bipolaricaulota bacterium]